MYQQLLDLLKAQNTDELVQHTDEWWRKRTEIRGVIKGNPQKLVEICEAYTFLIPAASENKSLHECLTTVIDACACDFISSARKKKQMKNNAKLHAAVLKVVHIVLRTFDNILVEQCRPLLYWNDMPWKTYSDEERKETLKIIAENLHKLDKQPDETEVKRKERKAAHECVSDTVGRIITTYLEKAALDSETKQIIAKICKICADRMMVDPYDRDDEDFDEDNPKLNGFSNTFHNITNGPCSKNADLCVAIMSSLTTLSSLEDHYLSHAISTCMQLISTEKSDLLDSETVENAVKSYIENPAADAVDATPGLLVKLYPRDPDITHRYIESLAKLIPDVEAFRSVSITSLIKLVAETNPQVINDKIMNVVFDASSDQFLTYHSMEIVLKVSQYDSTRVSLPRVFAMALHSPAFIYKMCEILRTIGTHDNSSQDDVMQILSWLLNEQVSNPALIDSRRWLLETVKVIAFKGEANRSCLMKFRAQIDQFDNEPVLKEYTQPIIDLLEGRSLGTVSQKVDEQGEQIITVTTAVRETKTDLSIVKQDVAEHGKEIDHLGQEVKATQEEVKIIKADLAEALIEIDRIDRKTVDTTPEWSHDVCKLLNPESDHDWRLLAKRLGYSNEEIKGWTSQSNPCMGMLNEWFATHKTYEAARAVYIMLKEMERQDAATVVEKAMKKAGELVPDDEPLDITHPPEVFISYQWGVQEKAKLIKDHLKSAGYSCWMDIGQMGGGDKLYEKIDTGIRNATLVLCLVTEKYAESPNCNKEVNLSMGLQKPLIPLLMEKMSWPPPGSMGPLFGEYLFIRFTARPTEEMEKFWAVAKMQELLVQMRYTVEPDPKVVTPKMRAWWKATTGEDLKSTGNVRDGSLATGSSPEIFISYQWGKQTQIRALHQQLTSLGYKCWLDINQMGGGDSLYDKIDKGIRGCGVVLSCVTTKYALSTNCRREISLADNLGKPIIPLLLESMQWPPAGPMAAPLTQLEYLDFTNNENFWSDERFDGLLKRLQKQLGKDISQLEEEHKKEEASQKATTKPKPKKRLSHVMSPVQADDAIGKEKVEVPKKTVSKPELNNDTSQLEIVNKADNMRRKEQEDTPSVVISKPEPREIHVPTPVVARKPVSREIHNSTPVVTSKPEPSELHGPTPVVTSKPEPRKIHIPTPVVAKEPEPRELYDPTPVVASKPDPIELQYHVLPEPSEIQYHPILPEPKKSSNPVPKQESKSCSIL